MTVSRLHTIYAAHMNTKTLAVSDVLLDQVSDFRCTPGVRHIIQSGDGNVDPEYAAVMSGSPRFGFSTTGLVDALGVVGIGGAIIDADGSYPGLVTFFQKMLEGGERAPGSVHLQMLAKEGILLPRTLQAAQEGVASLSLDAVLTYDGTNLPILVSNTEALVGSPSISELFTLGPVKINGTLLESVQSSAVEFGLQERLQAGDGDVWPTWAGVHSRNPRLRIRTTDAEALSTLGLTGAAISSSVQVWFRKMDEGVGGRVADVTAEHVLFTISEGRAVVREVAATQDQPAMSEVEVVLRKGAGAIMTVSTGSAIS